MRTSDRKWVIGLTAVSLICLVLNFTFYPAGSVPPAQENQSSASLAQKDLPSVSFRTMLEENEGMEDLVKQSIAAAAEINPDRKTNPVQSLSELYPFLDYSVTCMPWNIMQNERYKNFATMCDQSILYLYWLFDQPLECLKKEDLFYPSLQYLKPVYTWLSTYNNSWRDFLDTKASWKPEYCDMLAKDPTWHLDQGWYESRDHWTTFNEFFSRKLSSASVRPVSGKDDSTVVVSPADSLPQGVWQIDQDGRFEADPIQTEQGVTIKDSTFVTVEQLLGEPGADYAPLFHGGRLTHTYLNYDDYHRYHSPVSGTVKAVYIIPYANAVGGVVYWDPQKQLYVLSSSSLSWQCCETRGVLLIETDHGMAALIPVGMGQVSSVNFVERIQPGARIEKGDEVGYFLFGGSDCVMLFEEKAGFTLTAPAGGSGSYSDGYAHIFCNEEYGRFAG